MGEWLAGLPMRARFALARKIAKEAAAFEKRKQQGKAKKKKKKAPRRRHKYDASQSRCMKHHLAKNAKTFAIFRATGMHPEILEQLLSPIESPIVQRGMFKGADVSRALTSEFNLPELRVEYPAPLLWTSQHAAADVSQEIETAFRRRFARTATRNAETRRRQAEAAAQEALSPEADARAAAHAKAEADRERAANEASAPDISKAHRRNSGFSRGQLLASKVRKQQQQAEAAAAAATAKARRRTN